MSSYASNSANAATLAPLMRSYCALAMRNIDPWGRRWQQQTLSRNVIALDTDALLYILVEELPEHAPLLKAFTGLADQGVHIVIPEHVLEEAVGHIARFNNTLSRFASRLARMPQEIVNARVWHAVVRGYYYAHKQGFQGTPQDYLSKYWEPNKPRAFVEHLINRRMQASIEQLDIVPDHLWQDLNDLELVAMDFKERSRMKASFRDPIMMAARVRADISMALNLAERASNQAAANATGYLSTSDTAFKIIERNSAWRKRARVAVETRTVPELASFVCGTSLTDDEAVELLFHPVSVAAAEQLGSEIEILSAMGVDLAGKSLDRLEWDLSTSLHERIGGLGDALALDAETGGDSSAPAALALARDAHAAGYQLSEPIKTLVTDYEDAQRLAHEERQKRADLEIKMKALIAGALQTTNKGRTRINALVKQLGIILPGADEGLENNEKD